MKKYFFFIVTICAATFAFAHPGIGIVKDSKGNIYYTDLKQVWMIEPGGNKKVVVPGVHSHELFIDENDNLYGEHLWYNGETSDTWGHYAWRLKPNGELVREVPKTEGFLEDYSFARDEAGNMYWVQRFTVTKFMKRSPDGKISVLAEGRFKFIGWIYCSKDGTIYFTDSNKLYRLRPDGSFQVMADDLGSKTPAFTMAGRNYDGYGIWADPEDNIYVAMIGSKKINRIDTSGNVKTIYYSGSIWTASSGVFDNANNLWLLEYSATGSTRVRKIPARQLTATIESGRPLIRQDHIRISALTFGLILFSGFLLKKLAVSKKNKFQ